MAFRMRNNSGSRIEPTKPIAEEIAGVPSPAATMVYKNGRYAYELVDQPINSDIPSTPIDEPEPNKFNSSQPRKPQTKEHLVFDNITNKWKLTATTTY
jgi:hypothetical protein